jgi:hypothetical protein
LNQLFNSTELSNHDWINVKKIGSRASCGSLRLLKKIFHFTVPWLLKTQTRTTMKHRSQPTLSEGHRRCLTGNRNRLHCHSCLSESFRCIGSRSLSIGQLPPFSDFATSPSTTGPGQSQRTTALEMLPMHWTVPLFV